MKNENELLLQNLLFGFAAYLLHNDKEKKINVAAHKLYSPCCKHLRNAKKKHDSNKCIELNRLQCSTMRVCMCH